MFGMAGKVKCPDCYGVTIFPIGTGVCSECNGTGEDISFWNLSNWVGEPDPCPECSGSCVCQTCNGEGMVDDDDNDDEYQDNDDSDMDLSQLCNKKATKH